MTILSVDTDTMSYRMPPEHRGYYELSIAIIRTAVEDYRRAKVQTLKNGDNKGAYGQVLSLRAFFLSELFENLSCVENVYNFLDALDEQIESEYVAGIKRKRIKSKREVK